MIFDIFLDSNNDTLRVVVDNNFLENLSDALINKIFAKLEDFVGKFQSFLQSLTSDPYAVGAVSSTLPNIITLITELNSIRTELQSNFTGTALNNYRAKHVKALHNGR
jgi:hypothetical protein